MTTTVPLYHGQLEALGQLAREHPSVQQWRLETTNLHGGATIALITGAAGVSGRTYLIAANGKVVEL